MAKQGSSGNIVAERRGESEFRTKDRSVFGEATGHTPEKVISRAAGRLLPSVRFLANLVEPVQ